MTTLAQLTAPRSITVVGASDNPTRIGGRPIRYTLTHNFAGAILPVNPKSATVQGLPAYPDLADVPGPLDFVLIAIKAALVPEAVRVAVAKGARTIMIFSSGFAEVGEAGAALQAKILAEARAAGTRIVGPNCLGIMNPGAGFFPTFSSTVESLSPAPGHLGIASQSGAYGSHILTSCQRRGVGVRHWLTTGNESDLHVAELIGLMAEDDDTHAICAYVESVKDGPALVEALEKARAARKPVFVMKVGRSASGAAAASSHTASLAGEDAVYDAVLKRHGAIRVQTTEAMIDAAYAARPRIYPAGRRVGLVTISGGAGILMADDAEANGLDVAPMPEAAQAELKSVLPFAAPRNPVDATAQVFNDLALVPRFVNTMLEAGGYDALAGFWTSAGGAPSMAGKLVDELSAAMAPHPDRLFVHTIIAPAEIIARYEEAGQPCFDDPSRAVTALAMMMQLGEAFATPRPETPALPALPPLPAVLDEAAARDWLGEAGMSVMTHSLAQTAEEAAKALAEIGGPAALKIASPDIAHKSDAGGVALGVGVDNAAATFEAIMARVGQAVPAARLDGVLISPMAPDGIDCILGARHDPVFGPIVLFGLGGIFAEVLEDVALAPAPIGAAEARALMDRLRGAALLKGARGQQPCDLDALAEQISRFSQIAATLGPAVESLEINPLRALPKGCLALDALIISRDHEQETP